MSGWKNTKMRQEEWFRKRYGTNGSACPRTSEKSWFDRLIALILIYMVYWWSIVDLGSDSLSQNVSTNLVFSVGSLAVGIVILGVSSAVGLVPGVFGDTAPKSVGVCSVTGVYDVAGSKVRLESGLCESNNDEVFSWIVFLEISTFHIAIVPSEITEWDFFGDNSFRGSVPIVVSELHGGS